MSIEQLAREVGALPGNAHNDALAYSSNQVAAIIALVRAAALEEAASCNTFPVVASIPHGAEYSHGRRLYQLGADHLRLAIRALAAQKV